MTKYLRIKQYERFQHYRNRRPPWIKLYNDLLEDYHFGCLQDASKLHLVLLWLLASRYDNRIPHDVEWIARSIHATEAVNIDVLVTAGFIEVCDESDKVVQSASGVLASCEQVATPEREGEREIEREKEHPPSPLTTAAPCGADVCENQKLRDTRKPALPREARYPEEFSTAWAAYPRRGGGNSKQAAFVKWQARRRNGVGAAELLAAVHRYARYCEAKGWVGGEYVMAGERFFGPGEHWREGWDIPPPAEVAGSAPAKQEPSAYEVKLKWGNIEQRRSLEDGSQWWDRMQREAVEQGAHAVLYAYDRLHEPAQRNGKVTHG